LDEEETARQKLHLEKVTLDARCKKMEEDRSMLEDAHGRVRTAKLSHYLKKPAKSHTLSCKGLLICFVPVSNNTVYTSKTF